MPSHNIEGIPYKTRLLRLPCGWPNSCYDYCVVGCPCQLLPNASTTFFTHIVFFFQFYSRSFCHVPSVRFFSGLETEIWWLVRNSWSELLKRKCPTITFSGSHQWDGYWGCICFCPRSSKVQIINGPLKLLLFTCKTEHSVVLHLTW